VKPRIASAADYHIARSKPFLQYPRVMGHELAVEIVDAPAGSGFSAGDICVVNPYLSCGICHACSKGKPNCCAKISVLGVHQDGGMQQLIPVPTANLIKSDGLTADECATVNFFPKNPAVRRGMVSPKTVAVVGETIGLVQHCSPALQSAGGCTEPRSNRYQWPIPLRARAHCCKRRLSE
jgi:threonine dehydrogenase-like Zn-dependent dehydrogenase